MRRHHLLLVVTCCAARALAPLRSRSLLSLRGGGDDDGDAAGAPPSAAPPPPRGPVDAVHLRLLSTGRGRWLALSALEALDAADTYCPPLGIAGRYAWGRLCEGFLAPRWVRGAERRERNVAAARRAADPRSAEFQAKHRYHGLSPAEADAILATPFDKYARLSESFMRRERLGAYAAGASSSKDVDALMAGKTLKADRGSLRRAALDSAQTASLRQGLLAHSSTSTSHRPPSATAQRST